MTITHSPVPLVHEQAYPRGSTKQNNPGRTHEPNEPHQQNKPTRPVPRSPQFPTSSRNNQHNRELQNPTVKPTRASVPHDYPPASEHSKRRYSTRKPQGRPLPWRSQPPLVYQQSPKRANFIVRILNIRHRSQKGKLSGNIRRLRNVNRSSLHNKL